MAEHGRRPLGRSGVGSYDHAQVIGDAAPSYRNVHLAPTMSALFQTVEDLDSFKPIEIDVPRQDNIVLFSRLGGMGRMPCRIAGRIETIEVIPDLHVLLPAGLDTWWACDANAVNGWFHLHFPAESTIELANEIGPLALHPMVRLDQPLSALVRYAHALTVSLEPVPRLVWDGLSQVILHRLGRIAGQRASTPNHGERLSRRQAQRVIDFLQANVAKSLTLSDLAALCGVSQYHFARAFKNTVGIPPYRYQVMLRIERAKVLLKSTRLPIVDIAMTVGYESTSSFTRAFKTEVGVAPVSWRNEH